MNQRLLTHHESLILRIKVRTKKPVPIRIVVSDANTANTVFTNRMRVVSPGDDDKPFLVRMPLSPAVAMVQVYNENTGNKPNGEDPTFETPVIEKLPLETKMSVVDMGNSDVRRFVSFAQKFCYNAGWINTGKYGSGNINIEYLPTIYMNNGRESATPARIGENSGIIQVSQKIFIPFTIPMRFAILCHEFSHYFLNTDKYSETEADLQGLLIYLGLGYPRIEAYQAFSETFIGTPTPQNSQRYNTINRFITDFENHKFLIE